MGCNVSSGGCNAVDAAMLLLKNGGGGGGVTPGQMEAALAFKADKVLGAEAGNLAALDGSGNLADSGVRTAAIPEAERRLDVLYKLAKGQIYDTQTDSTAAYTKTVPSGAVVAEIGSIGGKTVVWNQYRGAGGTSDGITATYNQIAKTFSLSGVSAGAYASVFQNITVESGHKYLARLKIDANPNSVALRFGLLNAGVVTDAGSTQAIIKKTTETKLTGVGFTGFSAGTDFSGIEVLPIIVDLTQHFGAGAEPESTDDPRIPGIFAYAEQHPEYDAGSLLSASVTGVVSKDAETLVTLEIPAAVRALEGYGQSAVGGDGNTLNLADGTYTEIGHYVDGVWTALDTPVVTDVSALLPDNTLEVEAGGTLTFVQADGTELEMPNSVDYLIKLSEVTE